MSPNDAFKDGGTYGEHTSQWEEDEELGPLYHDDGDDYEAEDERIEKQWEENKFPFLVFVLIAALVLIGMGLFLT